MGSTSTRLIKSLASSLTIISALSLAACSGTPEQVAADEEVKSINVFFSQEDHAGSPVGKVYQYAPDSGRTIWISDVNVGNDSIAVLDTDEDAPGYEYAAIADGRTLKLIDYSKTATQRVYELQTYSTDICGVYAAPKTSKHTYNPSSEYYLKTIDDTQVYVALMNGSSCSRDHDSYRWVDFDLTESPYVSATSPTTSNKVFSVYLVDEDYTKEGRESRGRLIWVGHNRDTQALSAVSEDGDTIFEIPFSFISSPVYTHQVNGELIAIQNETSLFVLTMSTIESLLNTSDLIDPNNPFVAYFSTPLVDNLDLPTPAPPITIEVDNSTIVFEDDKGLFRHKLNTATAPLILEKTSSVTVQRYGVTNNGDTIAHLSDNGTQRLVAISKDSLSAIPLIPAADQLDFRLSERKIYVNAKGAGYVLNTAIQNNTWASIELNSNTVFKLLEGSIFIFADNEITKDELLLISSNNFSSEHLIDPQVYKYDASEQNGQFIFRKYNKDETVIDELTTASFGQIIGNLSASNSINNGATAKSNIDFGTFPVSVSVGGQEELRFYYYKPKQVTSKDENKKTTLGLVQFDDNLANRFVGNIRTLTEQPANSKIKL